MILIFWHVAADAPSLWKQIRMGRWYGFGRFFHVSALWPDLASSMWVHYSVERTGTVIELYMDKEIQGFLSDMSKVATIVQVEAEMTPSPRRFASRGWFSCVTATCHLCGLSGPLTPNGLFKMVTRTGAEIIHEFGR